jgi:two-component system, cell cycle response regulator
VNILVIEDNPSHLKLAHHVLSAAGYNVNDAGAAEQAVSAIKSDKPELILMDLELPGMDGLALVRKLKADPETRDIHIVAVTSYPERFPQAEMLAAGCAAYITKPINTRTLPGQLGSLMN